MQSWGKYTVRAGEKQTREGWGGGKGAEINRERKNGHDELYPEQNPNPYRYTCIYGAHSVLDAGKATIAVKRYRHRQRWAVAHLASPSYPSGLPRRLGPWSLFSPPPKSSFLVLAASLWGPCLPSSAPWSHCSPSSRPRSWTTPLRLTLFLQ